jgi:hypothetical protein
VAACLLQKLEEEVENLTMTLHSRTADNSQTKAQMTNIENKSAVRVVVASFALRKPNLRLLWPCCLSSSSTSRNWTRN